MVNTLTGPADHNSCTSVIEEMADLLAKHKLVPFFGAGVSRQHLGLAAAELARELAAEIDLPPEISLADLADRYLEARGQDAFVDFLRRKLVVEELDERKVPSHRLLLSLMQNVLYTTNQDNLYELVAARYGRPCRRVVTVDDLSESIPGEPLLIKFHGDTSDPASLVFGTKSYQKRMNESDHPLDIRLKSDLLGKRLMFLGYSMSDENVAKIFATVARVFKGTLPPSYLIAFDDSPELIAAARDYPVKVVIPRKLFPDAASNAEAFEMFLQSLCDETRIRQVKRGTENVFTADAINPHTVTDYEVRAATASVRNQPFDVAITAFRATFDSAHAPDYLHQEITDLFVELVDRADPTSPEQMNAFVGALFNFRISASAAFRATAAVMAKCNGRPTIKGYDSFQLVTPALPKGHMSLAAAGAVALLNQRGEAISDTFRRLADWWFRDHEQLSETLRSHVIAAVQIAWPGDLAARSPLQRRFAQSGIPADFHDILAEMQANFPKRPSRPKE